MKRRSAPLYGPCGSGRTLRFLYIQSTYEGTDPKPLGSCLGRVFLWSVVLTVGVVDHKAFCIGRRHSMDLSRPHYSPAAERKHRLTSLFDSDFR